jgi:Domain of unknown function (DUF4386)
MSEASLDQHRRAAAQDTPKPDPTWTGVYRAGGLCLLLTGLIYLVGAASSILIGPPPSESEAYLKSLAGHASLSRLTFGLFALSDLLLVPGLMALYLALKHVAKNAMLVGVALMGLFVVLDLAITELNSLTLVTLTRHYALGDTAARSASVAAADYALATLPIGTFLSYLVSSVGLLIVSLTMLTGIFSRPTAYVGIVASVEGILGGFYVVVPALGVLLVPCLVAFGVWALLAGSRLHALGSAR